jgi:hypothetical protein
VVLSQAPALRNRSALEKLAQMHYATGSGMGFLYCDDAGVDSPTLEMEISIPYLWCSLSLQNSHRRCLASVDSQDFPMCLVCGAEEQQRMMVLMTILPEMLLFRKTLLSMVRKQRIH